MADMTNTIRISFNMSDSASKPEHQKSVSDSMTIGQGSPAAASGVPVQRSVSDSMNVSASGVFGDIPVSKSVTDSISASGTHDSSIISPVDVSESVALSTERDGTTVPDPSGAESISVGTAILGEPYDDKTVSESANFATDEDEYEHSGAIYFADIPSVTSFKGTYYGRVPIDMALVGTGTADISAEYLLGTSWYPCSLSGNTALPSGAQRAWWDADYDLSANAVTEISGMRIWITGQGERKVGLGGFYVSPFVSPCRFPRASVEDWAMPASGVPPSGKWVPINPAGYQVRKAKLEYSQYFRNYQYNIFKETFGPSGVYPLSFIYDSYSDWKRLTPVSGLDYTASPGTISSGGTYDIADILDAGISVSWGQYEVSSSGTAPDIKFRASDTIGGLSSESWRTPSGTYMDSSPFTGRYLQWKAEFTSGEILDKLILYPYRNKFFDTANTQHIEDAGSDVAWSYITADYKGTVTLQYRYATNAEGSGALSGKSWINLDSTHNITGVSARYLEWKATVGGGSTLYKVITAFGDDDVQDFVLTSYSPLNLGDVTIRFSGYDDANSERVDHAEEKGPVVIDDEVPVVGTLAMFIWDNASDTESPRRSFKYLFQCIPHDAMSSRHDILSYTKTSPDAGGTFSITSGDEATLPVTFGDGSIHRIWTSILATDNDVGSTSRDYIWYSIRYSDDNSTWTSWTRVCKNTNLCHRSKYAQVQVHMKRLSGSEALLTSSIVMTALDGTYSAIVEEGQDFTSYSFDGSPLENDMYYYYRVMAFDGCKYSMWSRMMVVYVHEEGAPYPPTSLLVESQSNPRHIITFSPYFSWTFTDDPAISPPDLQQNARILVGTVQDAFDVWDSGKVPTASGMQYARPSGIGGRNAVLLRRGVIYHWKVKVWDDGENNLASQFSESSTFKLNSLPTVPVPSGVIG